MLVFLHTWLCWIKTHCWVNWRTGLALRINYMIYSINLYHCILTALITVLSWVSNIFISCFKVKDAEGLSEPVFTENNQLWRCNQLDCHIRLKTNKKYLFVFKPKQQWMLGSFIDWLEKIFATPWVNKIMYNYSLTCVATKLIKSFDLDLGRT